MATKMFAPAGTVGLVQASRTLTNYVIGSDGSISAAVADVDDLLRAGFTLANRASNSANGLAATALPLITGKNSDGSTLAASASSGKFGIASTLGTSLNLAGEAAQNNTKTDTVMFEHMLPANYVAGQDITLTVNAKIAGTGTPGTKTLTGHAYKVDNAGAAGSDLIATSAPNMTTSNADYTFTITGTTLNPGDRLTISLVAALQETGNSASVNAQINSVRLS